MSHFDDASDSWNLLYANYGQIKGQSFDVAVLPLGATEPHNLHLPYGTDVLEAQTIGEHLCQYASSQGARVVLLPTIPYGTETNMREFPLALNLNPSTLNRVIQDLVESIVGSGIRKIVLLNSHGGNDLKPLLREMAGTVDAHVFLCNWYQAISDCYHELFEIADDHAGEMETSFGLAFFPEWVARNDDGTLRADDADVRKSRFEALEKKWVNLTRPWHLLTTNSGSANPHQATADKGKRLMAVLIERLGPFLVELAQSPLDETFPFEKDLDQ